LVCGSGEPKIRAALLLSYNPLPVRVDSSFAVFLAATCKRAPGAPVVQFLDLASKILTVWLVSLTIHLIVYVMTTAVVIHSYRFFWKRGLAEHKIQEREASPADIRREIRSSLGTVLIFSVIYAGVYFGARAGVFTIYLGIHPLGWVYMLFSIAAIIVAHDAYFYWTHRLLHLRRFARFHRTHHQSITPTAYSCYAFDVSEAILHGCFLPIWLLIAPMQLPALCVSITFMMIRNILGHSGVELFAHGPERSKWFGWLVTNTDHDLHHATFHYNFGFHFTWWDRLMRTEHPGARERRKPWWSKSTVKRPAVRSAQTAAANRNRPVAVESAPSSH
jgi:sterol desaturase/sphingolipid hydroxylase (fatty acid hydroxylase superfamily)